MADSNSQPNGQRGGALDVSSSLITHSVHSENQDESDQRLHEEALHGLHVLMYHGHSQIASRVLR